MLEVLYHDDQYLVVNKPYDIRMDGPHQCTIEKLLHSLNLSTDDQPYEYRWVHQLDYATSGALCVALTKEAAAVATMSFIHRETYKEYIAILSGHLEYSQFSPITKKDYIDFKCTLENAIDWRQQEYNKMMSINHKEKMRKTSSWQDEERELLLDSNLNQLCQYYHSLQQEGKVIPLELQTLMNINRDTYIQKNKLRKQLRKYVKSIPTNGSSSSSNSNSSSNCINSNSDAIVSVTDDKSYNHTTTTTSPISSNAIQQNDPININQECLTQSSIPPNHIHTYSINNNNDNNCIVDMKENTLSTQVVVSSLSTTQISHIFDNIHHNYDLIHQFIYHYTPSHSHDNDRCTAAITDNTHRIITTGSMINNTDTVNNNDNSIQQQVSKMKLPTQECLIVCVPLLEPTHDFRMDIDIDTMYTYRNTDAPSNNNNHHSIKMNSDSTSITNTDIHKKEYSSSSMIGKYAETWITILEHGYYQDQPITKVKLQLLTGRRHQLRVHTLCLGCPIIGDATYNLSNKVSNPLSQNMSDLNKAPLLLNQSPEEFNEIDTSTQQRDISDRMMLHAYLLKIPLSKKYIPTKLSSLYFRQLYTQRIDKLSSSYIPSSSSSSSSPMKRHKIMTTSTVDIKDEDTYNRCTSSYQDPLPISVSRRKCAYVKHNDNDDKDDKKDQEDILHSFPPTDMEGLNDILLVNVQTNDPFLLDNKTKQLTLHR